MIPKIFKAAAAPLTSLVPLAPLLLTGVTSLLSKSNNSLIESGNRNNVDKMDFSVNNQFQVGIKSLFEGFPIEIDFGVKKHSKKRVKYK